MSKDSNIIGLGGNAPEELNIELRTEQCANCFWFELRGTDPKIGKVGICRINPPVPVLPVAAHDARQVGTQIGFQVGMASWPVVTGRDWCGGHPQLKAKHV